MRRLGKESRVKSRTLSVRQGASIRSRLTPAEKLLQLFNQQIPSGRNHKTVMHDKREEGRGELRSPVVVSCIRRALAREECQRFATEAEVTQCYVPGKHNGFNAIKWRRCWGLYRS